MKNDRDLCCRRERSFWFILASPGAFILIFLQLADGGPELEYTKKLPFGGSFDQSRLRNTSALVISTSNKQTSVQTPSILAWQKALGIQKYMRVWEAANSVVEELPIVSM